MKAIQDSGNSGKGVFFLKLHKFSPLLLGVVVYFLLTSHPSNGERLPFVSAILSFPWTSNEGLITVCGLFQYILYSYSAFFLMELLKESSLWLRVIRVFVVLYLESLIGIVVVGLLSFPIVPDWLSLLLPLLQVACIIVVCLSFSRGDALSS